MTEHKLLAEINTVDPCKMKHVEPIVENSLPTAEVIAEERQHQDLIGNICSFKRTSLKRTQSQEKNVLPDRENDQVTKLIKASVEAQKYAYNRYSNFPVGAAILTKEGKTYTGCNVENASYSLCICAERVAMLKAVSEGQSEFVAIAVSGAKEPSFIRPCGSCRQVMAEFNLDMNVYMTKPDETYEMSTVADLLPKSFILLL